MPAINTQTNKAKAQLAARWKNRKKEVPSDEALNTIARRLKPKGIIVTVNTVPLNQNASLVKRVVAYLKIDPAVAREALHYIEMMVDQESLERGTIELDYLKDRPTFEPNDLHAVLEGKAPSPVHQNGPERINPLPISPPPSAKDINLAANSSDVIDDTTFDALPADFDQRPDRVPGLAGDTSLPSLAALRNEIMGKQDDGGTGPNQPVLNFLRAGSGLGEAIEAAIDALANGAQPSGRPSQIPAESPQDTMAPVTGPATRPREVPAELVGAGLSYSASGSGTTGPHKRQSRPSPRNSDKGSSSADLTPRKTLLASQASFDSAKSIGESNAKHFFLIRGWLYIIIFSLQTTSASGSGTPSGSFPALDEIRVNAPKNMLRAAQALSSEDQAMDTYLPHLARSARLLLDYVIDRTDDPAILRASREVLALAQNTIDTHPEQSTSLLVLHQSIALAVANINEKLVLGSQP